MFSSKIVDPYELQIKLMGLKLIGNFYTFIKFTMAIKKLFYKANNSNIVPIVQN